MNPEEQNVTWLISLGVLNSPKKNICDPEDFLKCSLKDGVVLCKLMNRLLPGSVEKFSAEPKSEADCLENIREFLRACSSLRVELFDANDLYTGENFPKILSTLSAINRATEEQASKRPCSRTPSQSHNFASSSQINPQGTDRSSKVLRRPSKPVDMTSNGSSHLIVKAKFDFKQQNEDELSFCKGDTLYVTRVEDGGWWEGALNGKTGWFPSNYVKELKPNDKPLSPKALKGSDSPQLTKNYYTVVLQNILETERSYAKELQLLISTYLRPLQSYDKLSAADITLLLGNFEEIYTFQQTLCQALEECAKLHENHQKVGGCFLSLFNQFKCLYLTYCANHPSAVNVLTQHSDELEKFMEAQGAASPGILLLTTSLSKPFMRLEKYVTLLQELERHMEDAHAGHKDVLRVTSSFKTLVAQCQDLRKRKQLELQILSEPIQCWEGEDIKSLGNVVYMSQVMVQCAANEEKDERYFMLFPSALLMLSASPRMSGFIYQGKLPLTGMSVVKLEESDSISHAFEIAGHMIERIVVHCGSSQDCQEWLDHLYRLTKTHASHASLCKTPSWGTQSTPDRKNPPLSPHSYSLLPRGPLEPAKIYKAWTLSCLRPAPPLRPSAALSYKEDSSKSPKNVKKFLPKRKPERKASDDESALRKSTIALEEDAQILKVIEAYCTGAGFHQNLSSGPRKDSTPQVLLLEEESLIIDDMRSNGQTAPEEKSLVDTVYALRDEVKELKQENKRMKQSLDEEQKSRKELEKMVRKILKQTSETARDDPSH
ncbi:PREDICTED: rho guanine nucleotide exchange factor 6 isoform X2 [Nanorana parkeri]|uniref:rho guanine nucleotide exchange factor 6 isoform X2 n=1 Tax=Nanorana parkeri TaxID=125878 RepID=UPI0008544B9E|nr:PREDICTED: rho guanine nucleotide exchange factor 6 isoform X2 [Nanorana parkeri]